LKNEIKKIRLQLLLKRDMLFLFSTKSPGVFRTYPEPVVQLSIPDFNPEYI